MRTNFRRGKEICVRKTEVGRGGKKKKKTEGRGSESINRKGFSARPLKGEKFVRLL